MHWFLLACSLGALGALFKYWHWPAANLVALSGLVLLVVSFFKWLNAFGSAQGRGRSAADDVWSGSASDGDSTSSGGGDCGNGDSGGCDGGGD